MTAPVPAFGVGCAKSGTHSLAAMFQHSLRAAHEPGAETLMRLVLDRHAGRMTQAQFAEAVAALFASFDLALNVSQINGFIVETLSGLYPDARYILTLRDARSWLASFVNHQLTIRSAPGTAWYAFRDLRFRPREFPHTTYDAPLREAGLYSLDAYLSYWFRHNECVVRTVAPAQLLIVPTAKLARDAGAIAAFLGVQPDAADREKAHDYAGAYVETPLGRLDPAFLGERLDFYKRKLLEAVAVHAPGRTAGLLEEAVGGTDR